MQNESVATVSSVDLLSWLLVGIPMLLLLALSCFFSASEAALFSLTAAQRHRLQTTRLADRSIEHLLSNAPKLLSCILLCNLAVNITFFACANLLAEWIDHSSGPDALSLLFGIGSVGTVILFGELLPKSVGVLAPLKISRFVSIPMSIVMRVFGPLAGAMHFVNDIFRRLIWPGLVPESVLEISDLERAIELSETDSHVIDIEKGILQNVLQLSTTQAQEWMRPQSQFLFIRITATPTEIAAVLKEWNETTGGDIDQGTVLVMSLSSDEVVAIGRISQLTKSLEHGVSPQFEPLMCFPWCATLATVFQQMLRADRNAALIVNERGDSIGLVLMDDLIEAIFAFGSSSDQGFAHPHFAQTGEAQWEVTGITRIKQIERSIGTKLPECRDATIAGLLQSQLRRLAQPGDRVQWGPVTFQVLDVPRRGEMLVRITSTELDVAPEVEQVES